jgi:serine protease AprX
MSTRRSFIQRLILPTLTWIALATGGGVAVAQTANSQKIAADLRAYVTTVASGGTVSSVTWAKNLSGQPHVKVLINATSTDATLAALRQDILARGGSVLYNYISVRAVSAMLPATALDPLAARSDVISISPNRATARQGSLLQASVGSDVLPANSAQTLTGGGAIDGRGIGIAILDSGIDWRHKSLLRADGTSRVRAVVDFVAIGRAAAGDGWTKGVDYSPSTRTSVDGARYKDGASVYLPTSNTPDPYGHGTFVASVAAGLGNYQAPDSSGVAPGANLYDVRVLDERGVGNMADMLAGIDWVLQRARLSNIRVMNLSLGAQSTESFLTDPLARAARSATEAGLVVVAAAGNGGKSAAGQIVYGTVSSPGHDPSVITVGASNLLGTAGRADDSVTRFSSRGPTRGSFVFPSGKRWIDNLVKPDLVAPGNRILGALGSDGTGLAAGWNLLARNYPQLAQIAGASQTTKQTVMELSGTSVAAPAVAGAAALLLQANPGLTPPLVKAILQYTAQPMPNASLLEQGTGELNVEGAVRLAKALRTDIGTALAAGTLKAGDNLLAAGQVLPVANSTLNGQPVP